MVGRVPAAQAPHDFCDRIEHDLDLERLSAAVPGPLEERSPDHFAANRLFLRDILFRLGIGDDVPRPFRLFRDSLLPVSSDLSSTD